MTYIYSLRIYSRKLLTINQCSDTNNIMQYHINLHFLVFLVRSAHVPMAVLATERGHRSCRNRHACHSFVKGC